MATIAAAPPVQAIPIPGWRVGRWSGWLAGCLLCFGLAGVVLAVAGAVRGRRPSRRRVLLVLVGAAVQLVCAGYFTVAGIGQPTCPAVARSPSGDPWHAVRAVINAPVSGAAMIYAGVVGGQPCRVAAEGITVTPVPSGYARGGTIYGTVFLTDRTSRQATARIARLSDHEARHATQWAVSTLIAGPFTFPALYAADESLFPGAHNHFEQSAGLTDGGYQTPPDTPPAAGRLLFLTIGLILGHLTARRRARNATR